METSTISETEPIIGKLMQALFLNFSKSVPIHFHLKENTINRV
jgi:hypothetical protein